MSDKVVILTDVHGRFDVLRRVYDLEKPTMMVCLGDLANQAHGERRLDVGEYPSKEEMPPCPEETNSVTNILVGLEILVITQYPDERTRTVAGSKAAFLGGIGGGKRAVHWGMNGALDELRKLDHAFFLFSHDTCSPFPSAKRHGADVGNKDLAVVCAALKPKFHFSGHHHHNDYAYFNGVKHYRLPYAWNGYGVIEDGRVEVRELKEEAKP